MKKVIIKWGLILVGFNTMLLAQDIFTKGTSILNLGIGAGGYSKYGWGTGYRATPYIGAALDYGIYSFPDVKGLSIGLGGYLGWRAYSISYNRTWRDKNGNWHYDKPVTERWNFFAMGLRPTIHYSFENVKAEVYAGIPLGYFFVNYSASDPDYASYYNYSYGSFFDVAFFLGARYFFTDKLGVFLEGGYGVSYFNIGLSLKIK